MCIYLYAYTHIQTHPLMWASVNIFTGSVSWLTSQLLRFTAPHTHQDLSFFYAGICFGILVSPLFESLLPPLGFYRRPAFVVPLLSGGSLSVVSVPAVNRDPEADVPSRGQKVNSHLRQRVGAYVIYLTSSHHWAFYHLTWSEEGWVQCVNILAGVTLVLWLS